MSEVTNIPAYAQAIKNALVNGYRVDAEVGIIYGLKGYPLSIKLHGTQRYPTVPLVVVGMLRRYYVVPAHKVVAMALWGDSAFVLGIHVRHGKGGVLNISSENLSLGTPSENENDKDPTARKRAGQIARAAQTNLVNAVLTWEQVHELRAEHKALRVLYPKKFPTGIIGSLETKYGIGKTNISDIVKGKTWKI